MNVDVKQFILLEEGTRRVDPTTFTSHYHNTFIRIFIGELLRYLESAKQQIS